MAEEASMATKILIKNHWTLVGCVFGIATAVKILLFPAYRSTDFDVHNHWKSLTRHLNVSQWYFDDEFVSTVHTLDYPPGFAFFEYVWSNNFATNYLLEQGYLDDSCLALKESSLEQKQQQYSVACIAFMRSTVILSEVVYWIACYIWACIVAGGQGLEKEKEKQASGDNFHWKLFLLLSLNPALLWLDHVHFQYNGFLLGILLLSLACLWKGAGLQAQDGWAFHFYHLSAAALYAALLTLKHLYLTLGLWYFCYLLRKYCFVATTTSSAALNRNADVRNKRSFSLPRFLLLGLVTASTLTLPFVPFLSLTQMQQIAKRLFPFGRGLVHDYWAGNIWALYMAMQKVVRKLPQDLPPSMVALLLLCSLLPGCASAWKAASTKDRENSQSTVLLGIAYSALASFMTAYHVHEKAIVTTLLPLTIWAIAPTTASSTASSTASTSLTNKALLLFQTQAFALTGLLPLLFTPTLELPMKLVTMTAYLVFLYHSVLGPALFADSRSENLLSLWLKPEHQVAFVIVAIVTVVVVLEFVPMSFFGRFEFVPLAFTSVVVACGLLLSFLTLLLATLRAK